MSKSHSLKPVRKNELIRMIRNMQVAIKLKCYDCMGGQKRVDCELGDCTLWPFRPWAKNLQTNEDNSLSEARE